MAFAIATDRYDVQVFLRSSFTADADSFEGLGASLTRAQVAGRFSLVDHAPLSIEATRGLVVRVYSGALWAAQTGQAHRLFRAGERFVADCDGVVVVRALERGEIGLEWDGR